VTESGDIEAIKRLKARYFRLMDTKDWEGLAEVFADDVEIDMTGEGGRITRGVGEYVLPAHDARARHHRPSRAHARGGAHLPLIRLHRQLDVPS
jgi:hypothetical protein